MPESDRKMERRDVIVACLVAIYLIMLIALLLPAAFQLWPTQSKQTQPPGKVDAQSTVTTTTLDLLVGFHRVKVTAKLTDDLRMWLLVAIAGSLGGLLHALKSFCWYVGNREFYVSWSPMYLFLPLIGGILGFGSSLLVYGGLLNLQGAGTQADVLRFPGFAFLIGLFSSQALEKLKQVAENVFAKPEQGKDTVKPSQTFEITVDPKEQSPSAPGDKVVFKVTLKSKDGFASPVKLSASSSPDGVPLLAIAFSKSEVTPSAVGETSDLTIDTTGVAVGDYCITITGAGGDKSQSCKVKLAV